MTTLNERLKQMATMLRDEVQSENKAVLGIGSADLLEFADIMLEAAAEIETLNKKRRLSDHNPLSLDSILLSYVSALLMWKLIGEKKAEYGETSAYGMLENDLISVQEKMNARRLRTFMQINPELDRKAIADHIDMVSAEVVDLLQEITRDMMR